MTFKRYRRRRDREFFRDGFFVIIDEDFDAVSLFYAKSEEIHTYSRDDFVKFFEEDGVFKEYNLEKVGTREETSVLNKG